MVAVAQPGCDTKEVTNTVDSGEEAKSDNPAEPLVLVREHVEAATDLWGADKGTRAASGGPVLWC